MGDAVMELGEKELEKIGKYVQSHLGEWAKDTNILEFKTRREIDLLERMVRVEEGLKNIAEQMQKGFEYMEKRFEQVEKRFEQIDKRFEQVDKRFEQIDKRFEQVDKRFEDMQHYMDRRFSQLQWMIGIGFTAITVLMGLINFLK